MHCTCSIFAGQLQYNLIAVYTFVHAVQLGNMSIEDVMKVRMIIALQVCGDIAKK
jgi:hypothetical protein